MAVIDGELLEVVRRLRNWHHWQVTLRGVTRGYPGRSPFSPGSSNTHLAHDQSDAEIVETALSIFVKSWGRPAFLKLREYVAGSEPVAELARRTGQTRYLYETEMRGLLHKAQYCIEYVETTGT